MKRVNFMLGTWTAAVLAFLYLPIFVLVIYSFNKSRLNILWEGFTLQWYGAIWHDTVLVESLKNSLFVAFWTTLISVPLGTAGAWLLYRYRFPSLRLLNTLIFVPMIVPEIILGISLLIFFATINRNFNLLSLGFVTVIISHVTFCFPFVLVAVEARLAGLDPSLEEAALDLGATPFQAFRLVIIPYLLPAIISGALMAFTLSMDELIVTWFTCGPASKTLPIAIFDKVRVGVNPSINAISTLFIIGTATLVLAAEYIRKLNR
jgi:spermidine/putrescine transport system permease protein